MRIIYSVEVQSLRLMLDAVKIPESKASRSIFLDDPVHATDKMTRSRKAQEACMKEHNITLLTCILRLRIQPSVPYPLIARLLLSILPDVTAQLIRQVAPAETQATFLEYGVEKWLTMSLEQGFEYAERWALKPWVQARDMDRNSMEEILCITKLGEEGYGVAEVKETMCKCALLQNLHASWDAQIFNGLSCMTCGSRFHILPERP